MPQLLPLCGVERVSEDVRTLRVDVCSRLEGIEKRLQHSLSTPSTSKNGTNANLHSGSSQRQAPDTLKRGSNVVLLGIQEDKDLSIVGDVLQATAGSHIAVKDTFRLGKQLKQPQQTRRQQSGNVSEKNGSLPTTCTSEPTRPRPILIKLNCPWDRRIILAEKKRLSSINGMEKYFLQPDLPVEECKKRRAAYLARKTPARNFHTTDLQ